MLNILTQYLHCKESNFSNKQLPYEHKRVWVFAGRVCDTLPYIRTHLDIKMLGLIIIFITKLFRFEDAYFAYFMGQYFRSNGHTLYIGKVKLLVTSMLYLAAAQESHIPPPGQYADILRKHLQYTSHGMYF